MRLLAAVVLTAVVAGPSADAQLMKRSLVHGTHQRTFYEYIPDKTDPASPPPLLMLLHGSGRDGTTLAKPWQSLAKKHGIVLVAPDSLDRSGWSMATEDPSYLYEVIERTKSRTPIDGRRMYLFGHSAGGHHALDLAFLESEYFAAVAVHAGALVGEKGPYIRQATRKIPFGLWSGDADRLVPIEAVRATRDTLATLGFGVEFHEMKRHTHDYYGAADGINKEVWAFLSQQALSGDPQYRKYQFGR
jgi:poly(3-hydroxybutyrate) depolymerase